MRLDDEAVRVAIELRLGLEICAPHQCHCGAQVDAYGCHGLVCKKAPGRSICHHALNDLVARALSDADIPIVRRNRRAYADLTENALNGSLCYLGRVENLLFGTSQAVTLSCPISWFSS